MSFRKSYRTTKNEWEGEEIDKEEEEEEEEEEKTNKVRQT
jgi:hypothetical protein